MDTIEERSFVVSYTIYCPDGIVCNDVSIILPNTLTIDEYLDQIIHPLVPENDVDWENNRFDHSRFIVYFFENTLLQKMKEYINQNREHYFFGYRLVFKEVNEECLLGEEWDIKQPEECQ